MRTIEEIWIRERGECVAAGIGYPTEDPFDVPERRYVPLAAALKTSHDTLPRKESIRASSEQR